MADKEDVKELETEELKIATLEVECELGEAYTSLQTVATKTKISEDVKELETEELKIATLEVECELGEAYTSLQTVATKPKISEDVKELETEELKIATLEVECELGEAYTSLQTVATKTKISEDVKELETEELKIATLEVECELGEAYTSLQTVATKTKISEDVKELETEELKIATLEVECELGEAYTSLQTVATKTKISEDVKELETEELKIATLEVECELGEAYTSLQTVATKTKILGPLKRKLEKNEENALKSQHKTSTGSPEKKIPKTDSEYIIETQHDENEPVPSSERNIPQKLTYSVPSCFNNSEPQPLEKTFIYIIMMNLEVPISTETNDLNIKLEDPANCPISLGILINKEIPQIPEFPIFSTYGLIKIKLVKGNIFTLSEDQMENIRKFHQVVFEDLLEIKNDLIFSPSDSPMPFYIVPIKNDLSSVDFNTVNSIKKTEVKELKNNMQNDFAVASNMFTYGISWLPIFTKSINKISKTIILGNVQKKIYLEYIIRKLSVTCTLSEIFFMQILSLPVTLYRINSLLMAENIIENVSSFENDTKTTCNWGYFKMEENTSVPSSDILKENDIIIGYLIKTENTTPSPCDVLQGLTLRSVNDVFNLEKLEILGDTFLKLSTTLFLFCKYEKYSSQELIKIRTSIINNTNLCIRAKKRNFDKYIIRDGFNERIMIAPCYTDNIEIKNIKENKTMQFRNAFQKKKILNYKKVADVVESTIGVYLLCTGEQGAIKFMRWMGLLSLANSNNTYDDYTTNWPPGLLKEDSNITISQNLHFKMKNFEENINYSFKNKRFLLEAVSYSKQGEIRFRYDRLCVLGDSILEFFTIRNLYEHNLSPYELHHRKIALVNKDFKGCVAIQLKMQQFFEDHNIKEFVSSFETSKSFIFFKNHGYLDYDCDDVLHIDVPRPLGQMLIAVIGAIFLDNEMDLNSTWKIFSPLLQPTITKMKENLRLHPITEYQQLMKQMKNRFICVSAKEGADFMVKIVLPDETEVVGRAKRIQVAKRLAAIQALHKLKKHNS